MYWENQTAQNPMKFILNNNRKETQCDWNLSCDEPLIKTLTKLKFNEDTRYQPFSVIKGETGFEKRLIDCFSY